MAWQGEARHGEARRGKARGLRPKLRLTRSDIRFSLVGMTIFAILGILLWVFAALAFVAGATIMQEIMAALLAIIGTLFLVCASLEGIHATLRKRKPANEKELQQIAADLDWFRELKAKEIHEARERATRKV